MLFDYALTDYTLPFPAFTVVMRAATNFEACVDQMFAKDAFSEAHAPYGAALWPAALALADTLCKVPSLVAGKRTLELGGGLGLGAIVAKKLGADVTASDFHPDMETLFAMNAALNHVDIPYLRLDWADPPPLPPFDLIIASDVLYDLRLAPLCLSVLQKLLAPGGLAIVTDPQRGQLTRLRHGLKESGFSWSETAQHAVLGKQSADCIVFSVTR